MQQKFRCKIDTVVKLYSKNPEFITESIETGQLREKELFLRNQLSYSRNSSPLTKSKDVLPLSK
jgi:hypothetical protein